MPRETERIENAAKKSPLGIVRDERGQDQPADKKAALSTGNVSPKPASPTGQREQKEAAETTPMNPGEPAGGE